MENPLKQRPVRARISTRAASEVVLMEDALEFCARVGVRPKVLLHVALRSAMEDPLFLEKARAHEAATHAARRQVRLKRQAIYRHRDML